jgi:hypothetical protein
LFSLQFEQNKQTTENQAHLKRDGREAEISDRNTSWFEVIPIREITVDTIAKKFKNG